jgi:hypothetical protein
MSLAQATTEYAVGPDDGEAMWFNGGARHPQGQR